MANGKARCITFEECFYGAPKGIRAKGWCLSREEWVARDPAHNYVDIFLNITIFDSERSGEATVENVCKDLSGGILIGGHICSCPEGQYSEAYYDYTQYGTYTKYKCIPVPTTLNKGEVLLSV